MPIPVTCPNPDCGAVANVEEQSLGKRGRCKKCGHVFALARPGGEAASGISGDGSAWKRSAQPASPTNLPEQFGRYRIMSQLGQGGMGAVYLAFDTKLEREVALKVPYFNPADGPQAVQRFEREARAAATLDHPNLCPIHDVGEIDGIHFLTMPYIKGKTLAQAVGHEQTVTEAQAAAIGLKLAQALQEAHDKGIIHRDLKPGNIMINRRRELVVMDFGLARMAGGDSSLTGTGNVLGTALYMAPEQAAGDLAAIGPTADVYSLGVIVYELLTGRPPFDGPWGLVIGLKNVKDPDPPSKHRPDLSPALDAICHKAIAREPKDRYATMTELAQDLGAFLKSASSPVLTPSGTTHPERKPESLAGQAFAGIVTEEATSVRQENPAGQVSPTQVKGGSSYSSRAKIITAWASAFLLCGTIIYYAATDKARSVKQDGFAGNKQFEDTKSQSQQAKLADAGAVRQEPSTTAVPRPVNTMPASDSSIEKVSPATKDTEDLITNTVDMKLKLIPAGEFSMGAADGEPEAQTNEKPQHKVRISRPFYMGVYEVTQEEYRAVVGSSPSSFSSAGDRKAKIGGMNTDRLPVENVSWLDAVAFCNTLSDREGLKPCYTAAGEVIATGTGYRLPTEAEWEYACRAGTTTPFSFGATIMPTDANFNGNDIYNGSAKGSFLERTALVGSYHPNAFGLHDMHGNVWEWCYDCDCYDASAPRADLQNFYQAGGRVCRGGSWHDYPRLCRSAFRGAFTSGVRSDNLGFRVVRNVGKASDVEKSLIALSNPAPTDNPSPIYGVRIVNAQKAIRDKNPALAERLLEGCSSDERGWEWRYLKKQTRRPVEFATPRAAGGSQTGGSPQALTLNHATVVSAVAFNPAGTQIASAYPWARSVQVADVKTGKPLFEIKTGHQNELWSLSYSPDGKHIITGSFDYKGTVEGVYHVWDASNGRPIRSIRASVKLTGGASFSADGRYLLGRTSENRVVVFDANSGQELRILGGEGDQILGSWVLSPQGRKIAYSRKDEPGTVKFVDLDDGREVGRLRMGEGNDVGLFFQDGLRMLMVNGTSQSVWDLTTGKEVMRLDPAPSNLNRRAVTPDGRWLVGGTRDGFLHVWDVSTGRDVLSFLAHSEPSWALSLSRDGRLIASGSFDKTTKLWELSPVPEASYTLSGHGGEVNSLAFSQEADSWRRRATISLSRSGIRRLES